MKKLSSLEKLSKIIQGAKNEGQTIVLDNGCFYLTHVGHARYLKGPKQLGDLLVVALNSDASVQRLKGKGRPYMSDQDRAIILGAFSCVDYLVIFPEDDVSKVLLTLKPDIHAKGSDYTEETVPERRTVLSYGGQIAITGGPKVCSKSEIIKDIAGKHENKNLKNP